jgi:NAD(P)-dependent dehydrogenase (short-subunit alcohol dehydrogenase family)
MKLENKVAFVTGGGQGIGRGIVKCLAEEGADLAIITKSGASGEEVAKEVEGMGQKALSIKADVTDKEQVNQAVKEALDAFGKIDILVNNVGGGSVDIAPFLKLEGREWDECYELNVKSQVNTCQAIAPHFIEQKSGRIINLASIGGKRASVMNAPYGSTKAAVIYFSKALAAELGPHHINVNCICPAGVFTPTYAALMDKYMIRPEAKEKGMTPRDFFEKVMLRAYPFGREVTPEDIGKAAVFFASDDAMHITGQTLNVDAGVAPDVE